jgi:hypothetical protein
VVALQEMTIKVTMPEVQHLVSFSIMAEEPEDINI